MIELNLSSITSIIKRERGDVHGLIINFDSEASRDKFVDDFGGMVLASRATPSTSTASDAELPKDFCEVLGGYEIWRESDVRTIWNAARAASTRTASDTRTAAGEAECDAALGRAAPAGQHGATLTVPEAGSVERIQINVVEMCEDSVRNQACAHGSLVDGHAVYCHNGTWPDAPRKCRRTWYTAGVTRDEDCEGFAPNTALKPAPIAAVPVPREGGNTKQDALQELAAIAQANNMGYGPAEACSSFANSESGAMPRVYAEVDVEAGRPAFEAWHTKENDGFTFLEREEDGEYVSAHTREQWYVWRSAWLAARTQADAGKDADMLRAIRNEISGYYRALDSRQHGGVAQNKAFMSIESALGMCWEAHRAAIKANN